MVISAAVKVAAKILLRKKQLAAGGKKWRKANPEKVRLSNKIANQRMRARNVAKKKAAQPTIKKTDYFIRKKPITPIPGSTFAHGDWIHELPKKKLRHERLGTAVPPMRDFSPKQDIHMTNYFPSEQKKFNNQHRTTAERIRREMEYFDKMESLGVPPPVLAKEASKKVTEQVKKYWWKEFLKQSRAGKHIGVAGAVGGLGVYAASKGGKK